MAKETCSSRLTRARKKKKKEKEIILRDGNSRIYEAKHDPRQWWNMVARFAVCRQGYGNKIIKGMVEEGGIRERERGVYPVADRMRNGEKEKGTDDSPAVVA